ncbi:MAG: S8 family serine peptidase [Panacagrimonas sp.]
MSKSRISSIRFRVQIASRLKVLAVSITLLACGLPLAGTAQAATAETIQPSAAVQIGVLQQIKGSKSKTQSKIDSRLYMGLLGLRGDARTARLPDFRFVRNEADGRVMVDLVVGTASGVPAVLARLDSLKAVVVTPKKVAHSSRTIRARVRLQDLEALATMNQVEKIRKAVPALNNATSRLKGPVVSTRKRRGARDFIANALDPGAADASEGVQTHGADLAVGTYGTNGVGVKICVMSDGVSSLSASQDSGDLPADVDVLPGQAGGGDEGTAMLEIVHDMAPGAELGFATAFNGQASFAQNILDLAAAGCDIIVDDIIYLNESPWQDGPVAQAVNTVTAAGVLYFSSAGNEGNLTDTTSGTWEGNFAASTAGTPAVLAEAGPLHDFGDGGQSISVEVGGGNPVILIWAEHYDLTVGNASTDYDVYDLDDGLTTILDASADLQDGVGGDDFPVEFIDETFSDERLVVARFSAGTTSSAPAFNLIVFRGELDDALATSGATRGHSAAANAFSTAATPADAALDGVSGDGPFPGLFTATNTTESFSSDGPRRILLSPTGVELTPGNRTFSGGVPRQKPDLTAADGVSTAAPGFSTFYGTSASAPHAAAIAGLLKSAVPSLTAAQVRGFLTSTAIDIEASGVDRSTGFGIVMPVPALVAAGATPQPVLSRGAEVLTQVTGDGDSAVEPNETFSVRLPLSNIGAVTASSVSVTLSTTSPDVDIVGATSAYPNIAVNASRNNTTAFSFTVLSSFVCGSTIAFTAVATSNSVASPQTFKFSQKTGGLGAPATFSYTGAVVPIPDATSQDGSSPGATVNASVLVSGVSGNVGDVNLSIGGSACSADSGSTTVGLDHTFINDLQVRLRSPSGANITLIGNTDGGGNNLCRTVLDDESSGSSIQGVATEQAPFTGSFKPALALSGFDGTTANGTWSMQAQDFFEQDTGSIRAFSVTVRSAVCNAPPVGSGTPAVKFRVTRGTVLESVGSAAIEVVLDVPAPSPITVPISYAGSARFGIDYAAPAMVTIPGGASGATFNVAVINDTRDEPARTVRMTLGTPSGATLGNPSVRMLTIYDNDPTPTVQFVASSSSTAEDGGTRNVVLRLSAASDNQITVPLQYGGSATRNSDYNAPGSIMIPSGSMQEPVPVRIVNDSRREGNETVVINLADPQNAGKGSRKKHTLTINRND